MLEIEKKKMLGVVPDPMRGQRSKVRDVVWVYRL